MAKMLMEKKGQKREYFSRIIETQEHERERISWEFHDEIGQALTAIKFNPAALTKTLRRDFEK